AVLTLTAVVAGYALILKQFGRSVAPPGAARAPEQEIRAYMDAGQKAMSEGSFRLALEELDRARELREQYPQALSPGESRRLSRLHREAGLLAGLLRKSLEEILHEAAGVRREEEWQAQFRDNYRDRSLIFDDVVRREADGRCWLAVYEVRLNGAPVRLELG